MVKLKYFCCPEFRLYKSISAVVLLLPIFFPFIESAVSQNQVETELSVPAVTRKATFFEKKRRAKLAKKVSGRILFDSRRGGDFGVYTMLPDGSDVQTVSDTPFHELNPSASPDGRYIVFVRTRVLGEVVQGEIVLHDRFDDSQITLGHGNSPSFASDSFTVFYESRGAKILKTLIQKDEPSLEVFPLAKKQTSDVKFFKPRVSPDFEKLYFTANAKGENRILSFEFSTSKLTEIGKGFDYCPFSKFDEFVWVSRSGVKASAGLVKLDRQGRQSIFQDSTHVYGQELYPFISGDDKFLLFSAMKERDFDIWRDSAQIFIKDLETNDVVQITFNDYPNRWPQLIKDFRRETIELEKRQSIHGY